MIPRRQSARLSAQSQKGEGEVLHYTNNFIQISNVVGGAGTGRKRRGNVKNGLADSDKRTTKKKATSPFTDKSPSVAVDSISQPRANFNGFQNRIAESHMTNAPLQTPRGTRVLVTSKATPLQRESRVLFSSNDQTGTTTENLLQKACAHLISVDPNLKSVVEKYPCQMFSPEGLAEVIDPFKSLVRGICAQQVSGAAANSIKNKFVALYNEGHEGDHVFPTPTQVAATDIDRLRSAGLSQRKAEYIKGLAEKFVSGELSARMLIDASDDELLDKLVSVRGLGRWSAEMFACFALKRMDIFSTGDLGVQRGIAAYLGKDVAKLKTKGGKWKYATEQEMLDVSEKFSPYRTLFMWLMWRIENTDTQVLE